MGLQTSCSRLKSVLLTGKDAFVWKFTCRKSSVVSFSDTLKCYYTANMFVAVIKRARLNSSIFKHKIFFNTHREQVSRIRWPDVPVPGYTAYTGFWLHPPEVGFPVMQECKICFGASDEPVCAVHHFKMRAWCWPILWVHKKRFSQDLHLTLNSDYAWD